MKLAPVILAGGGGTRLWPLSREHYPKQFINLFNDRSMLQNTLSRLQGLEQQMQVEPPLVVCNEVHRFLVADQCEDIGQPPQNIVLESKGRNTAPALTIAALALMQDGNDPIMLMMPADHMIKDIQQFQQAIYVASRFVEQDYLFTFGIAPAYPDTGYGYIHYDQPTESDAGFTINPVLGFKEKPDESTAQSYIDAGDYLWNSGIFMMKASVWLQHMEHYNPDIVKACRQAFTGGEQDGQFYRLEALSFAECRSDSIDIGVMEKLLADNSSHVLTIPIDIGWSDMGAWSSIWQHGQLDENGNCLDTDVLAMDTRNTLVKTRNRLIAAIGCDNLVIVDTDDVTLVASKDKTQDVKQVVEQLKLEERNECLEHVKVHRPWGTYQSVDNGESFQVKRIVVKPGKKLSLQMHHKRAEHWVVVKGTATVTRGEDVFELRENESTFIPLGVKHRLENATTEPLEIIEVQSGTYLGEDDIVRFDDDFGRS